MFLGLTEGFAAGLSIACLLIVTGALHEDGLADVADGVWGGNTPQERLDIMKDSQIGTYGTLALIIATGLRWLAYAYLLQTSIAAIVAVAAASRAILPTLMCKLPNARSNGLSHDVGRPDLKHALVAAGIGLLLAVILLGWLGLVVMLSVVLAAFAVGWIARAKLSGQTGDVLGATQQIAEVTALTALVALT
jgi:adenosylcobinamide-GDP ribazoletransferase